MGLGCMRLSTDENRDGAVALATIAAAAGAGMTVFDTAHSYGLGADELGHNEALLARALRRAGDARADRDEGRHDAHRRSVGAGRSSEGDPFGLRGEPRGAGRPSDRSLSHPRTRSANAVANLRARTRASRRRRPRQARRARERQPAAAGRGARARSGGGGAGRDQSLRRPRASRRRRRALHRRGGRGDRALAARRAAPRRRPGEERDARPDRGRTRRNPGRGRARVAARSLLRRGRDSGSTPPGDRSFGRIRCDTRPGRGGTNNARARARRGSFRTAQANAERRRRRGRRHGHPGSREEPRCRGVRRSRLSAPQPRRARRLACARSQASSTTRSPPARDALSSTTRISRAPRAATSSTRRAGTPWRRDACGSTHRSRRLRSISSSGCSIASALCRRPAKLRLLARSEQGVLAPTSQMRSVRELEPPSMDEGFAEVEQVTFARERADENASRSVRRGRRAQGLRLGAPAGRRRSVRASPRLRLEAGRHGGCACSRSRASHGRGRRTGGERVVPASSRPADVLVPAAASRSVARVCAGARRRSGEVDTHRRRPGAPDPRDDARRSLRRRLIAFTS